MKEGLNKKEESDEFYKVPFWFCYAVIERRTAYVILTFNLLAPTTVGARINP